MEKNFIDKLEKKKIVPPNPEEEEEKKDEDHHDLELSLQCSSCKTIKPPSSSSSLPPPPQEQIHIQELFPSPSLSPLPPPEHHTRPHHRPRVSVRCRTTPPPYPQASNREEDEDHNLDLDLSLQCGSCKRTKYSSSSSSLYGVRGSLENHTRPRRQPAILTNRTIPSPYPWATDQPAKVHNMSYLLSNKITTITGKVRCNHCETMYDVELDLMEKLIPIYKFFVQNIDTMRDRAPKEWQSPRLLNCNFCSREAVVKPIIPDNKDQINWLFLFLTESLGWCKLDQLKFFCGSTDNHRTGAKDRVLYLAYMEMCKQLDPQQALASDLL